MNYRQIKAIEAKNKKRILAICPTANEHSGIYIFRREENDFKYAYVGQAKHILTRLAEHLKGYQHIDLSIRNHGLYSEENPTGWSVRFIECDEKNLDTEEQRYIKIYANAGYQMRNKTAGGQGAGKSEIAETRPNKGYYDGLKQGYKNAVRDVAKLFEKNLCYAINGKVTKRKENALQKFEEIIKGEQK